MTLDARQLRAAAALVEKLTPLRIDVPTGQAPPRRGKHLGLIRALERRLGAALPPGLAVVQGASVELPGAAGGYVTPDLLVCPNGFLDSDESLLHPRVVALAVVIGPRSPAATAAEALGALLRIDPHAATWTLNAQHGAYGEAIPLPPPLTARLSTDRLARFAHP